MKIGTDLWNIGQKLGWKSQRKNDFYLTSLLTRSHQGLMRIDGSMVVSFGEDGGVSGGSGEWNIVLEAGRELRASNGANS